MRVSEVLTEGVEKFLALAPSIESHMEDKNNPHRVTKENVGLGNVSNDLQAKDADFRSHKNAAELDHPEGSVTTAKLAKNAVTAEKIAAGAVGTDALSGGAVSTAKLANNAVTREKIMDGHVTAEKIAADAVGGDALQNGCVTENILASGVRRSIETKVEKETGKGLSQNDYTDADKAKLDAITLVDNAELKVDTAALLMKDRPLTLYKTGQSYVKKETLTLRTDATALHMAESDLVRNHFYVLYTGKDGKRNLLVRQPNEKDRVIAATADTTRFCYTAPYFFFSALNGNTLTIYRGTVSIKPEQWMTLTLSKSAAGGLQDVFVESSSNIWVIYYDNLEQSSSQMYVERFDSSGVSQWVRRFSIAGKTNGAATNTSNDTVFDERFRKAVLGADGQLYVAPPICFSTKLETETSGTSLYYGIFRLNTAGAITGTYGKHTASSADIYVQQDITVQGGYIYSFARPSLWRFDTEGDGTGIKQWYYKNFDTRHRGLTVDYDGRLHVMGISGSDVTSLFMVRTNIDRSLDVNSGTGILINQALDDAPYSIARFTEKGLELLRIEEGTTTLTSTVYAPAETYTVA